MSLSSASSYLLSYTTDPLISLRRRQLSNTPHLHPIKQHKIFISDPVVELNLLIFSQSDIETGIALANRVTQRSGFTACVTVVSEKPQARVEQVKSHIAELPAADRDDFKVESFSGTAEEMLDKLDYQSSLRVLLVPGLGQLDDFRRELLKSSHTTVICYETHPGLLEEPSNLWLVGEDRGGFANWFAEHVVAYPELRSTSLEGLQSLSSSSDKSQQLNDLVLVTTDSKNATSSAKQCKAIINEAVGPVILVCGESTWIQWFFEHQVPSIAHDWIPQMSRDEKRVLAEQLQQFSKPDFEFIALICSATFLASFGLLQNSAAVIIGAMLVAPLMTPILGAGLSLAHGNKPLFRVSLKTILYGFCSAIFTSCLFGLLVRLIAPSILEHDDAGRVILTSEMWSRTHPTAIDFLVGLVGGAAAAFARTRAHLADALAGAAIAAALVPPIATAGLQISLFSLEIAPPQGFAEPNNLIYGPVLLFVANMLTIMIGSSTVLWACGIRSDHSHSNRERWTTRMLMVIMTLTVAALVWIIQHP